MYLVVIISWLYALIVGINEHPKSTTLNQKSSVILWDSEGVKHRQLQPKSKEKEMLL